MDSGKSRENMEYHAQRKKWAEYNGTKSDGQSSWRGMSPSEYIKEFYRATKGRASKAFRPAKSRDKK